MGGKIKVVGNKGFLRSLYPWLAEENGRLRGFADWRQAMDFATEEYKDLDAERPTAENSGIAPALGLQ